MSRLIDGKSSDRMAAIAGAFAGSSLLFVSVLFGQRSSFDLPLWLALYCFVVAVPGAALAVILAYMRLESSWLMPPFWVAGASVMLGVGSTVWHVDWKAGCVYFGVVVVALLYFFAFAAFTAPHDS